MSSLEKTEKSIIAALLIVAAVSVVGYLHAVRSGADFARCVDEQKAAGLKPNC